ncbi:MAG: NAD-dependent epimerase/dehydratase family protein [Campylobacteraceae bacterium]|nr:NAD-dependent epimerase/dehydratase family protein [Campylobacteraceae bacterium]
MIIIVGKRSNLSKNIALQIEGCILISNSSELETILNTTKIDEKIELIFNNFQISTKLNNCIDLAEYIDKSIYETSKTLDILDKKEIYISKIIYTSSSSVYGNNKFCSEIDNVMPMSLQASLKVANEELIKRFCESRSINYTITRVFNMYGGDDRFSVISKIKDTYIKDIQLNIINSGSAIRDFIYIFDVVDVYKKLLKSNNIPRVLNIASGNGKRVQDILNFLRTKDILIKTVNTQRNELKASIANIDLLDTFVDTRNFMQVEDYLLRELRK